MTLSTGPFTAAVPDGRESNGRVAPDAGLRLEGPNVVLRPVRPQDYELIRQAETGTHLAGLWRHRGATPSPEMFSQTLWVNVLAQFLVVQRSQPNALGIVALHDPNFQNRFAHLSVARFEEGAGPPLFIEGVCIFLDYVFAAWEFFKLYAYTNARSMALFQSAVGNVFVEEGRLRGHSFFGGQRWDEIILSLYRDRWAEVSALIRPRLQP